jgi:hypothetical protein
MAGVLQITPVAVEARVAFPMASGDNEKLHVSTHDRAGGAVKLHHNPEMIDLERERLMVFPSWWQSFISSGHGPCRVLAGGATDH